MRSELRANADDDCSLLLLALIFSNSARRRDTALSVARDKWSGVLPARCFLMGGG